jgi:hypothetical protein
MGTTSSGIVLRQISELVGVLAWKFACPAPSNFQSYEMSYADAVQLQVRFDTTLLEYSDIFNLVFHVDFG